MPNGDENWNNQEWFRYLSTKIDVIKDNMVSKDDLERVEGRVQRVEDKTSRLAVKQAGIAGAASMVGIWIKSTFFGS